MCERESIDPFDTAYVGDSIAKDVLMAKGADVFAIWAHYGANFNKELYQKLVRVSHWTPEDVAREMELKEMAQGVRPDYVLENSFQEILGAFDLAAERDRLRLRK